MKSKYEIKILVDEHDNKTGVLMSVKNFKKMMNELEDLQDLDLAYKRMSRNSKPISWDQAMKELFGDDAKK